MSKKHVFLSYCRDNADLVAKLRDDLMAAGEQVWWDQDILPGQDSKLAIRQAMKQSYAVVLCLSAETESRTTSGIYPEAADAVEAYRQYAPGKVFLIPVRLSQCEIPPVEIDVTRTLDRLQYVDLFPPSKYQDGLRRLVRAIQTTGDRPGPAGEAPPAPPNPLRECFVSFDSFIEERTHGFVGREFVFDAIEAFQSHAASASGYFVVEGKPGMGKSAILAEYVKRTGCVSHFNIRAQGINRADTFLRNVCAQLATRYHLGYSEIPDDAIRDGRLLARMLEEASGRLGADGRIVVAVDALDEVDPNSQSSTANTLYLPESLPQNVHFLLTTRKLGQLVSVSTRQTLDLRDHEEEGRRDVCRYIERYAERAEMAKWIHDRGIAVEAFVEQLAAKSENNFMYLRHVLPAIERGRYDDLTVTQLPSGLEKYYEDHWNRMGMSAKPLPEEKLKIIYVLAAVNEPVSASLLEQYTRENQLSVQETLDDWTEFLTVHTADGRKRYSFYHGSFREFLHRKDIVQAAQVSLDGIADLVIDDLWGDIYQP